MAKTPAVAEPKVICGAKKRRRKNDQDVCQRPPVHGRTRCRLHGGNSPKGFASPHFKHGRRSKYLPARLVGQYQEAMADRQLMSMRSDVALVDARINDLLTRVDAGESGRLWSELTRVHAEFTKARSAGKVEDMQERLAEMEALIRAGRRDHEAWSEIIKLTDQRRKLVESERKRVLETQQVVTSERLVVFMSAMLDILTREVTDRAALMRISNQVMALATIEGEATEVESVAS